MNQPFRLSRLRAPRGNLVTSLLVAVVFIAFGLVVSTLGVADSAPAARYVDGSVLTFTDWLFGQL
jgi:hypothetical protein